MSLIIFVELKKIFSCVLTLIQNAINFGGITIVRVGEQDLVIANGLILKITMMIIWFVGTINKKITSFSQKYLVCCKICNIFFFGN